MGDPHRKVSASFPKALAADKVPTTWTLCTCYFHISFCWPYMASDNCHSLGGSLECLPCECVCVQVALEEVDDVCKCRHIEVHGMTTSNSWMFWWSYHICKSIVLSLHGGCHSYVLCRPWTDSGATTQPIWTPPSVVVQNTVMGSKLPAIRDCIDT